MKIYGLIGEKLSHSLSPLIHNKLYDYMNIEAAYSLFQVPRGSLPAAVSGLRALGIDGINVTIPYKIEIMEYLDSISPEALRIGAVNTVNHKDSYLTGHNTDYIGFGRMLHKYGVQYIGQTAVILGSGGAAKSVVTFLEDHRVDEIVIVAREPEKVTNFDSAKYKIIPYSRLSDIKAGSLLINCTPAGMHPNIDASPVCLKDIVKFHSVVDLIYNPQETLLMKHAASNGIPTCNGLYMLVAQATAAFEIWTGLQIADEITDSIFNDLNTHMRKSRG